MVLFEKDIGNAGKIGNIMNFETHRFSDGQIVVISVPKYLSRDISEEFKDYLYSLVYHRG